MAGPTIRPGGAGGPGRGPGRGMRPGGKPKDMQKTLLRLWDYISTDKVTLAFVFFCVIFSTVSSLAGSYMLRPVINSIASGEGDTTGLLKLLLIMLGIYAAGIVTQYLQSRIMIGISQKALLKLRNDLFTKVQRLPVRF